MKRSIITYQEVDILYSRCSRYYANTVHVKYTKTKHLHLSLYKKQIFVTLYTNISLKHFKHATSEKLRKRLILFMCNLAPSFLKLSPRTLCCTLAASVAFLS